MWLLKPDLEVSDYVAFSGFAPFKREFVRGRNEKKHIRVKGFEKSHVMKLTSDQVEPMCLAAKSFSLGGGKLFCVDLFVHWFIYSVTSSIIKHGKPMLAGLVWEEESPLYLWHII